MKRYLYTADVLRAEGTQTFCVDAESKEAADALVADGEIYDIHSSEVDVTQLGQFHYEGETTTDDSGDPMFDKVQALSARVAELEAQLKKNDSEAKVLVRWVADLEAYMRTIATFGGTLDQARELAAKGIERAALLAKEKT